MKKRLPFHIFFVSRNRYTIQKWANEGTTKPQYRLNIAVNGANLNQHRPKRANIGTTDAQYKLNIASTGANLDQHQNSLKI